MNEISANAVSESLALLLSLIYPTDERTMTEEQRSALAMAAEEQAGSAGNNPDSTPLKSRSVGDVSVTYDTSGTVQIGGRTISPAALAILKNAGLLCRWV